MIFLKDFIYLFLETGEGREKERQKHLCERETFACCLLHVLALGPGLATQACALTGNQTDDPLVRRLALSPLSHTSQGKVFFLIVVK